MRTAVCRQRIHRTAQVGNRLSVPHPLLQELDKRLLVEIQIGCLQDEVLHGERCIIVILLIRRCLILHPNLRHRQLPRNVRLRAFERRGGMPCRSRTDGSAAQQCCRTDAPSLLVPMTHLVMHDPIQLLNDADEYSSYPMRPCTCIQIHLYSNIFINTFQCFDSIHVAILPLFRDT